jgi:apoptosis-inducing factor 3
MDTRRIEVGSVSDLENGQMKEVSVDETPILLARTGDKYFALSAHCTHYGAPLVDGVLNGDRIVCPWHHACFNARTGDCEEPPALDSLAKFDVTVESDKVILHLPVNAPDRTTPEMAKRDPSDERVFVILGGGAAGYAAAQTLREDGFNGRVVMITRENRPPYDRPNLSKDYLQGHAEPEWMPLRPDDFFAGHDIELMLQKTVTRVSVATKRLTFEDGETLGYDSILIATGGTPRTLPFASDTMHENVFTLRSFSDTDAIIAAAGSGAKVAVIGASFIGMEAACSLKVRGCDVTLVSPDQVPFQKTLGPAIGALFQGIHEENGVKFRLGARAEGFVGDGKIEAVVLDGGERLEADLVLVGIGVVPSTGFLDGVELRKDGGVVTDDHLCIADDSYAAGDITHFPDSRTGELTRIEHWRTAMQQGRTAAHNMAGRPERFTGVPFFWTTHFGSTLNYVGHARVWDRIIFDGDVDKQDFLAFYVKDHRVLAVAGMNRDREIATWEELIRLGRVPSPDDLGQRNDDTGRTSGLDSALPAGNGM